MPVSHLALMVSHLPSACSFYLSALQPLGYRYIGQEGNDVGLGIDQADFFLCQGPHGVRPGAAHVAFSALSRIAVREFYAAALNAGGRTHGAPALRNKETGCFNAAVLDFDGNSIEVVFKDPDTATFSDVGDSKSAKSQVLAVVPFIKDKLADNRSLADRAKGTLTAAASIAPSVIKSAAAGSSASSTASSVSGSTSRAASTAASSPAPAKMATAATTASAGAAAASSLAGDNGAKKIIGTLIGAAAGAAVAYAMVRGEADSARQEAEFNDALAAKRERERVQRPQSQQRAQRPQSMLLPGSQTRSLLDSGRQYDPVSAPARVIEAPNYQAPYCQSVDPQFASQTTIGRPNAAAAPHAMPPHLRRSVTSDASSASTSTIRAPNPATSHHRRYSYYQPASPSTLISTFVPSVVPLGTARTSPSSPSDIRSTTSSSCSQSTYQSAASRLAPAAAAPRRSSVPTIPHHLLNESTSTSHQGQRPRAPLKSSSSAATPRPRRDSAAILNDDTTSTLAPSDSISNAPARPHSRPRSQSHSRSRPSSTFGLPDLFANALGSTLARSASKSTSRSSHAAAQVPLPPSLATSSSAKPRAQTKRGRTTTTTATTSSVTSTSTAKPLRRDGRSVNVERRESDGAAAGGGGGGGGGSSSSSGKAGGGGRGMERDGRRGSVASAPVARPRAGGGRSSSRSVRRDARTVIDIGGSRR